MKTSDLRGPSISGSVTVPLAELDQMRADHARAISLAAELESKQGQVKVILRRSLGHVSRVHETGLGRSKSYYITSDEEFDETVEYRNFDAFRSIIEEEERTKVLAELSQKEATNNKLVKQIAEANDLRDKAYLRETEVLKEKRKIKEEAEALEKEVAVLQSKVKALEDELAVQVSNRDYYKREQIRLKDLLMDKTVGGKISKFLKIW